MKKIFIVLLAIVILAHSGFLHAEEAMPLSSFERMPVREITVFKDGHAFVLHSGRMSTTPDGNVVLDHLPKPVMGTFWPYSSDKKAKLAAVTAAKQKVLIDRTAINMRDLIEANKGAEVIITEKSETRDKKPVTYEAVILDVPAQTSEELEATSPPYADKSISKKGDILMLETDEGTRAIEFNRILNITFKKSHKKILAHEESRDLLTLELDWKGKKPGKKADIGMGYLQKGLRWIPNYKVTIDGNGNAVFKLNATLINEMIDLEDVTAHLVIGVPTFAFKDTPDPISFEKAIAKLSQHFQQNAQTAYALSNSIMTQNTQPLSYNVRTSEETDGEDNYLPGIDGAGKNEDLFLFTVKHVSLKKGERMVLPVCEFSLKYKDVYTLDIPYTPPPEVWNNIGSSRHAELARLFHTPKVMHAIRLKNTSNYPLTTAPAMIIRDNRVLAQGMMKYTAVNASTDLEVTTAVDITVKKKDTEIKRTPNAANWQGYKYGRIDLAGNITLTNHKKKSVVVELKRHVLGNVTTAEKDGAIEMVNTFEDSSFSGWGQARHWWGWFSWPYWWYHFNSVGRITWQAELKFGKPVNLGYEWHYFWRG